MSQIEVADKECEIKSIFSTIIRETKRLEKERS